MRTIVDITDDLLVALDRLCEREGISRAEGVRRAVAAHVQRSRATAPVPAFGLWRDQPADGLDYERKVRRDWTTRTRRRQR